MSAAVSLSKAAVCAHCGAEVRRGGRFCCAGCEAVYGFLRGEGLSSRYYALRGPVGVPAVAAADASDRKWLEPIADDLAKRTAASRVELDVQGMHCSACVWLVEALFRRAPGGVGIVVNPAVGRATLTVEPSFDVAAFAASVERVGYRLGPAVKDATPRRASDLLWRMGVCVAIAMNTMIFAIAAYSGLDGGPIHRLFGTLSFFLSLATVIVGGPVFFRSAWRAVRARTLHLDLPIALGILLAFASSTHAFLDGRAAYFDTLDVFVALMLVGRFLQERVLLRNRADILASAGAEHIHARRVGAEGRSSLVRAPEIGSGDRLLVARADLVPVDARAEVGASFSLDWIVGESHPRRFAAGETIPAGSFSCNATPVVLTAAAPFAASTLASLLRTAHDRADDAARATPFWQRLARVWVVAVLVLAVAAFAGWWVATRDVSRALSVVTALLIVTCPCAFGIATPLAYELAQAGLRRAGLFVRSPAFLDRALAVKKVVFDKTGTLTTGALRLVDVAPLLALDATDAGVLAAMAAASAHPKSRVIAGALVDRTLDIPTLAPIEHAGRGTEARHAGHVYRLGAPRWACGEGSGEDVVFARDGAALARLTTEEDIRVDAPREVRALGLETWVLSGDAPARVRAVAASCGVDAAHAIGAASPEDKAAFVRAHDDGDLLFVGDGINDALAASLATCSGTPAIDRPFMAARTDFYLVTAGLRPVRLALVVARRLAPVVRTNLAIATAYNVVTVSLAVAGLMSPLACAVLMPLSSLSTVLAASFALGKRSRTWRS